MWKKNLHAAVSAFFLTYGTNLISSAAYLKRRKIKLGSSNVRDFHKGFSAVDDTQGSCRRHLMRLLHMVKNSYDMKQNQKPLWNFSTSSKVDAVVRKLYELCATDEFGESCPQVTAQMQCVLEALFMSESQMLEPDLEDDFKQYTVYRYVITASIKGGDWGQLEVMEVHNITSICASFVYWARLFVLISMLEPEKYAPRDFTVDKLLDFVQDGQPTPFNALVEVMKLGKYLSGPTEGQRPIGYWKDSTRATYLIKSVVVTKSGLQNLARVAVKNIKDQLQWRLLRGFDTSSVRKQISTFEFTDLINDRTVGQWFMSRPENDITVTPGDFLSYLTSSTSMHKKEGANRWDERKLQEWLHECDEFMDLFLFTVHLTFGQPSRASELAALRVRDSNLAFRSVLAIRNRMTFLSYYHKSMNVTGEFKPIARFAPLAINADILLYFYLVRPIQAYFSSIINRGSVGEVYLDGVFVKFGKIMEAEQIRVSIAKGFAAFSDMKLDVSTYRHVAIAFVEVNVRPELIRKDLLDEQAGHSRKIGNTAYARNANNPSSLSRDQLDIFWNASQEWQTFLGMETNSKIQDICSQAECTLQVLPPAPLQTPPPALPQFTPRTEQISFLQLHSTSSIQRNKWVSSNDIPAAAFARAKHVVEQFTGDKDATFTCPEQGLALATILGVPPQHRLFILPTGGGKSLLYMVYFIENPSSDKTSLVIVPSAALLNESVIKCNLKNILSCKFSIDLATPLRHFNLVFVAVEQIKLKEFGIYVSLQANLKRMYNIFIDEAHLVMTATVYRPAMLFVPTLVGLGVPLTLMSATIPKWLENDLSTAFHVDFETIRASTNRSNLSYSVQITNGLQKAAIKTMKVYHDQLTSSKSRCIAYCMTCKEVDNLSKLFTETTSLSSSAYHAKMSQQEQSRAVAQWKSGIHIWMVAMSALYIAIYI